MGIPTTSPWPCPGASGIRPFDVAQGEPTLDGQQEIAADQGQPRPVQDLDVDHNVDQGGLGASAVQDLARASS